MHVILRWFWINSDVWILLYHFGKRCVCHRIGSTNSLYSLLSCLLFSCFYFCLLCDVGTLNGTLQTLKHRTEHTKTSTLEFHPTLKLLVFAFLWIASYRMRNCEWWIRYLWGKFPPELGLKSQAFCTKKSQNGSLGCKKQVPRLMRQAHVSSDLGVKRLFSCARYPSTNFWAPGAPICAPGRMWVLTVLKSFISSSFRVFASM